MQAATKPGLTDIQKPPCPGLLLQRGGLYHPPIPLGAGPLPEHGSHFHPSVVGGERRVLRVFLFFSVVCSVLWWLYYDYTNDLSIELDTERENMKCLLGFALVSTVITVSTDMSSYHPSRQPEV